MKRHAWLLLALFAAFLLVSYAFWLRLFDDSLRVYFLDVGQGDAVYVRAPGGGDMLVDGGPSSLVLSRLSRVMPFFDRSIDVVIATHPDADHIGGLPAVLSRYEVGLFVEPGVESENAIDDEIGRILAEAGVDRLLARRGMTIDLGRGAAFEILFPSRDVSMLETNTASIVGRLSYGPAGALLTGDSPKVIETELVRVYGDRLRSDVLKVGHHGSHTSSSENFVRAVLPRYAVISAGKDNRYGHPHAEVVSLFERLGVRAARTDQDGTVAFESDGGPFERK